MSVRIAHFMPDSPFLPFTADIFENAVPGSNQFVVHSSRGDLARHELPASVPAHTVIPDEAGYELAVDALASSDVAIFHSVGGFAAEVMLRLPSSVPKVWSGWGGDYYGSSAWPTTGLLGRQTARWERGRMTLPGRLLRMRRNLIGAKPLAPAARAADYFSAPIPDDLAVFRRRFRGFRGRYAQLNYASVEDSFSGASEVTGDDILVGNSASLSGNHFEVLELLAKAGAVGRRIVTPLSYGDPVYAEAVTRRGEALFGSDFVALREFIPFDEYQGIVAACSVVVMGHRRQQAIGNVAMALWSGARVVLDQRSPLTTFLRREGATIGTLAELGRGEVALSTSGPVERVANRAMLQGFWGRDRVIRNARALIATATRQSVEPERT